MTCIAFFRDGGQLPPMLNRRVGENIRATREAKKLSLQQVTAKMGEKHWQTLQKIEAGDVNISVKRIEQIAKALDVPPAALLDPEIMKEKAEDARELSSPLLSEQAANAFALGLARAALADPDPPEGTVQIVALALRGIFQTIAEDPEAATDPKMARLAANLLNRPPVPLAN